MHICYWYNIKLAEPKPTSLKVICFHNLSILVGREDNHKPFEFFFLNETTGKIKTTYYDRLRIGMYHHNLKMWRKYFPQKQIKVIDASKFALDPVPILQETEEFLDIPRYIQRRHFKKGPTGFFCINKKNGCMKDNKGRKHPEVSKEALDVIREYYKPFNKLFFEYINQTMSWGWKHCIP